ncbi:DUF1566 domain-containing protein [Duganella sp.]|uniref:Lcl domain-containing protein n=1 Tax=Duganella sp. TaxID=1904440 RepID=UPI0031DDDE7F
MSPVSAILSITEEPTYSARLGNHAITGLTVSSKWEGLTKYTDRAGQHLIVLDADQRIITASPDIIAQLGAHHQSVDGMRFGAPLAGGYFVGVIEVKGQRYAVVVSPVVSGEFQGKWNDDVSLVSGATSRCDGLANTKAMAEAGSDLAKAVLGTTINGYSDWYIPAKDELEMAYRQLKPTQQTNYADGDDGINPSSIPAGKAYTKASPEQTTVALFADGGREAFKAAWYWTSSQHEATAHCAWSQGFNDGFQLNSHKSAAGRVRAFRRFAI